MQETLHVLEHFMTWSPPPNSDEDRSSAEEEDSNLPEEAEGSCMECSPSNCAGGEQSKGAVRFEGEH